VTGEVVNLRLARKRKLRAQSAAEADANRAKHGRTKAERREETARREAAERALDGHKREED